MAGVQGDLGLPRCQLLRIELLLGPLDSSMSSLKKVLVQRISRRTRGLQLWVSPSSMSNLHSILQKMFGGS